MKGTSEEMASSFSHKNIVDLLQSTRSVTSFKTPIDIQIVIFSYLGIFQFFIGY